MDTSKIALPLTHAETSQLLIVNVQERLVRAMPKDNRDIMVSNINRLAQAARLLDIPVILSEHYAKGLGDTLADIRQHLPEGVEPKDKLTFSCCTAPGFEEELEMKGERKQIILVGLEAHICILQTASGLQQWGYQVFVVDDAIASRNPAHRENAVRRLRQGGVCITNSESVAFEWMGNAGHPQFSGVSQLFR